jgi:lipoprotein-releasing system permease protein
MNLSLADFRGLTYWVVWLVLLLLLPLITIFMVSIRFLIQSKHGYYHRLRLSLWIGKRFLWARSSMMLSKLSAISILGVTLGVWLILVTLGILAGFENDLVERMVGAGGHITIERKSSLQSFSELHMQQLLAKVSEPFKACHYAAYEVIIASNYNYTGALLHGVAYSPCREVLQIFSHKDLNSETWQNITSSTDHLPNLVMGSEMARMLSVEVGDNVQVISPMHEVLTPFGSTPKSMQFRVGHIFDGKLYEFDAHYAYGAIENIRSFFDLKANEITGTHLRLQSPELAVSLAKSLSQQQEASSLHIQDWQSRNQTLFSALKLEKLVAFIVLAFIIVVAAFSVSGTIAMRVIEKKSDIAILKSFGATASDILAMFLFQGLWVGGIGAALGIILGIGTLNVLHHFSLGIPTDIYYIDALPVKIHSGDICAVWWASMLIVWDFSVLPSYTAALISPIEGLRDRSC